MSKSRYLVGASQPLKSLIKIANSPSGGSEPLGTRKEGARNAPLALLTQGMFPGIGVRHGPDRSRIA
jgi:hypothetical protein